MTDITGGCLCGAVRFSARAVEQHFHACHCGMCRRWASGPMFATEAKGFELQSGAAQVRHYRSSEWAERAFCSECGANLYYHLLNGDLYFVSVGAFDDPGAFQLAGELYVDHQPDGYAFAGELQRMTEADVIKAMGGEPPPA